MVAPTQDDRRQAEDALSFIRKTMESATTYTALSGWGVFTVGIIGVLASLVDYALVPGEPAPFRIWIPAAIAGLTASTIANARKSRDLDMPLWTGALQKIAMGLAPALIAGTFLTLALQNEARHLVPGMWLAVYGAGVVAGGIFSIPTIRVMGGSMLALGGVALFAPEWGSHLLLAGFGGIHLACGLYLVAKYGG